MSLPIIFSIINLTAITFFFFCVNVSGSGALSSRYALTDFYGNEDRRNVRSLGHRQSQSDELHLVRALTGGNYSKFVKPKRGNEAALIVQTRLYLIRIQEIDEAKETFYSTVRFQVNWQDPALSWNPAQFGNISTAIVPGGLLWVPDLQVANAVEEMNEIFHDPTVNFRVDSDGNVWFHPTGKIATRCKFDLTFYPLDYQRCLIILESVIYQEDELKLIVRQNKTTPVSLGMFAENEVWELVSEDHIGGFSTAFRSGDHTVFPRVHFWIIMKRKSSFYIMTVIIPVAVLAIVTLFTYLVPIHYIDRSVQAVTVLVAVAVFEATIADNLPKTSAKCLITIYLTVILVTSAVTIFTSTICLAIVDPGLFIDAPWGIPNLARKIRQKLISCCSQGAAGKKEKKQKRRQRHSSSSSSSSHNSDNNKLDSRIPTIVHPTGSSFSVLVTPQETNIMVYDLSRRQINNNNNNNKVNTPPKNTGTRRQHRHQHREIVPRHKTDPERHLSHSKTAWFVAYAINWAGFIICFLATIIVPTIFFVPSVAPVVGKYGEPEGTHLPKYSSYYGD